MCSFLFFCSKKLSIHWCGLYLGAYPFFINLPYDFQEGTQHFPFQLKQGSAVASNTKWKQFRGGPELGQRLMWLGLMAAIRVLGPESGCAQEDPQLGQPADMAARWGRCWLFWCCRQPAGLQLRTWACQLHISNVPGAVKQNQDLERSLMRQPGS